MSLFKGLLYSLILIDRFDWTSISLCPLEVDVLKLLTRCARSCNIKPFLGRGTLKKSSRGVRLKNCSLTCNWRWSSFSSPKKMNPPYLLSASCNWTSAPLVALLSQFLCYDSHFTPLNIIYWKLWLLVFMPIHFDIWKMFDF